MWPARSAVPPACAKFSPCGSMGGHILFAVRPAPSANCHEWLANNLARGCLRDLQGQRSFCSAAAGQPLFGLGDEHACHRYFSDTQHSRQHNASNWHLVCECACISGRDVGLGEGGVAAQRSSYSPSGSIGAMYLPILRPVLCHLCLDGVPLRLSIASLYTSKGFCLDLVLKGEGG